MAMTNEEKAFFAPHRYVIKGRIFHPELLEPKPNKENTKTNYRVMFAFKAEENKEVVAKLGAMLQAAKEKFHPNIPMQYWTNPVKQWHTHLRRDGKPNPDYLKGYLWVNAATGVNIPPVVCKQGPMGGLITLTPADKAEVYSGRNAVIEVSFFKIDGSNNGISTNVNSVLLLDGGEREGGGAGTDVNKVFGGFLGDMGISAPTGQSPFAQPLPDAAAAGGQMWTPQGTNTPPPVPGSGSGTGGFI